MHPHLQKLMLQKLMVGLGLASHLGVLVDIPTVGVAKTLFAMDGLQEHAIKQRARETLLRGGDQFELRGDSGRVYGVVRGDNNLSDNNLSDWFFAFLS